MEPLDSQGVTTPNQIITDIISRLPEDMLIHILSFIPTVDAVRTFILLKAWADKYWRNNLHIDISDSLFGEPFKELNNFVEFVSRVLHLTPTVNTFRLALVEEYNPDQIKSWISEVITKNVGGIYIVFRSLEAVVHLPPLLFHCTSLKKLKLLMPCIFLVPAGLFQNLKNLHLSEAQISSELNHNSCQLLLHFPVLKKLKLEDCKWINVRSVEIEAPALIKLQVLNLSWSVPPLDQIDCPIKISVGELQLFEFCGYILWDVDLHASSISCVDFFFHFRTLEHFNRNAFLTQRMLKRCWFIKSLKLEGEIVKAIFQSGQRHLLHELTMLKRLELYSSCDSKSLLEFLSLTPSLEHICLHMHGWETFDYHSLESMPSCVVSQLVEVKFIGFEGTAPHVNLASFFLNNGAVLRKMLGLARRKCEERREELIFWVELKRKLTNGDFDVGE